MTNKISTTNVTLAMMSYLVKHPKNPDGIDIDTLNKMTDPEIIEAYNKWKGENNDLHCRSNK